MDAKAYVGRAVVVLESRGYGAAEQWSTEMVLRPNRFRLEQMNGFTEKVIELSFVDYEALRADEEFALCRARQKGGLSPVLVLKPVPEHPSRESLVRLEHEYSLREELDLEWAVRPIGLAHHWGRTVLVLEDPGGWPLDQLLGYNWAALEPGPSDADGELLDRLHELARFRQSGLLHRLDGEATHRAGQPMELGRFLQLAANLAAGLGKLHRRGLIHKDIKPAHILVDPKSNKVWFTGFGISSRLARERQAAEPPEMIAGTLAYMAPEQTGWMNRSIDSRSDLYSLGVALYQVLTGNLPFTASDPMEWVHCHVARHPEPPAGRVEGIPKAVSDIIMKLLAKTAEERYQTAAGVESDLRRCQDEYLRSSGVTGVQEKIHEFPLGEHDTPDRLLIPEKLYGRASETETLLASFDRVVASGMPELVLVCGYSGIGKSSVVNELHKVLVPPRGLFASGKFDQYKRDIPYSTLAQAFRSLVRPLLSKSEAELRIWRDAFRQALGPNGLLIVDLVPELKLVIGAQPPVPVLPPRDAQRRFQLVFRRFLSVFTRPEHPLALFFDDLQWLDAATLDLLEDLLTQPDVRHLMLIGAYRDNEVDSTHPLMRKLEGIRTAGAAVHEIVLAPLAREDLEQLIGESLRCEPTRATSLARLLYEKTAGNPFFSIQFLSSLVEEGLLDFDHRKARWSWNIRRIHAKDYTDNVVDLMVAKLGRLPVETQKALKQLACLGNSAAIGTLATVFEGSEEALHAALWEAVTAGLVLRGEGVYRFLHDRVQEAVYGLISVCARPAEHLRIGRLLKAHTQPEEIREHVFEIVSQLNRGAALITSAEEQGHVAELNLIAARRAKQSTAYKSALSYLAAGIDLLGPSGWETSYDLAFSLTLERAECTFLSTRFDETEELITDLLRRAVSNVDKAAVYRVKIELHVVKSQHPQAVNSALECLRLFGVDMPAHPTRDQVAREYEKVWRNLGDQTVASLVELPIATAPEAQAAMRVLTVLITPAYNTDINLFDLQICQMVNLTLKYGLTDGSVHGFGWFGGLLCYAFQRYHDGYRFGKVALDLVEKRGLAVGAGRVYYQMGFITSWMKPLSTSLEFFRTAFRKGVDAGDHLFSILSASQVIIRLILTGVALDEVWRESEHFLEFARKVGFRDGIDRLLSQQRFIAAMRGRTAGFSTYSDAGFDEATFEKELTSDRMTMMVSGYWIRKIGARFLSGDYRQALEASDKAKRLIRGSTGQIQLLEYHFYTAITLTSFIATIPSEQRGEWRARIVKHGEQLRHWAQNCPETFGSAASLVEAETARIDDRDLEAMRVYDQAICQAREQGFIHTEGIANELAARFYAKRGFETIAQTYLLNARHCYLRWGADGKVRQLEEIYPDLREKEPAPGPAGTIGAPLKHLDLATVLKVSQAISSEIVLEKLVNKLLQIAVEQAGAERGLLILARGNEQRIEAEALFCQGSGGQASSNGDKVAVHFRRSLVTPSELPESLLRYVSRTQESVTLVDASSESLFSQDEYIRRKRPRSVFCVPLIEQGTMVGVLYLENSLAPGVFTSGRLAILELIASQAAISLEQARLYAELSQENNERRKAEDALRASEERWRKLFENSSAGIALITPDGRCFTANLAFQKMLGYTERELQRLTTLDLTLEEDRAADEALRAEAVAGQWRDYRVERRFRRKDGSVIWADVSAVTVPESESAFFAAVIVDISERKQAEEELRRSEAFLAQGQRIGHTGSWGWHVATGSNYWSQEHFRIFECEPETDKPSYSLFMKRLHPEDRGRIEEILDRAVREKSDFEFDYRIVPPDGSIKFLRSVGEALINPTGELEFIGTTMDITDLKRAEEMQIAIAREREVLMRQRAADLAKANAALLSCLDALVSVRELDAFIGQVMATITRQLGAVSSNLRVLDAEQKGMRIEFLFQDGSVISPADAGYPKRFQSLSLEELGFVSLENPVTVLDLDGPQGLAMPSDLRAYLREQGVKTQLIIPLVSQGQINGVLTLRFAEERNFQAEELEIARALATHASLAIHLIELAKSAKQSAVLEERNRLAGEIHDSLAQSFAGISMQLTAAATAMERRSKDAPYHVERANELSRFGLSEARRSVLSLRSNFIDELGLVGVLRKLAERSNIPGLLRCTFCSNRVPEEILSHQIQHDLLRIAQEAISNALRHAQPTDISVSLRWNSPNLVLNVTDNGSGFVTNRASSGAEGFGLASMRARAKNLGATLEVCSKRGTGTSVVVRLPVASELARSAFMPGQATR